MNRQWLLHERPVGMIGPEHFKYVETDIPEPGDGEVLIRNLMFSFDPTQRGWTMDRESYLPPVQIGEPISYVLWQKFANHVQKIADSLGTGKPGDY